MKVSYLGIMTLIIAACGSESATIAEPTSIPQDAGATSPIQEDKDTAVPVDGSVVADATPDSSAPTDASTDAPTDANDAGVKGCNTTFVGSCRYSQQSDCWDYYGGNPDVFCPLEGGHTFSVGHCADPSPYNGQPLAMKCHFPATTTFGNGICKVMYRYGAYGPTMQSYCESNNGAVIYP
jgi:hypothetical protein